MLTLAFLGGLSKVPADKQINFEGTDLLTIDLESRKVRNATGSSDLLVFYQKLGYDLGVETPTGKEIDT